MSMMTIAVDDPRDPGAPRDLGDPRGLGDPRDLGDPQGLGARRWWALGALMLAALAVGLDSTVLSVALPTLARGLHASESDLQWFSSGYLLVLAAAMLPAGLLGDRYGHKKVFLISLGLFGVGSAACGLSTSGGGVMGGRGL